MLGSRARVVITWCFIGSGLLALAAGGCSDEDDKNGLTEPNPASAKVRFVNLSADSPALDVFVEQVLVAFLSGIEFATTSSTSTIPETSDSQRVDLVSAGHSPSEALVTDSVSFLAGDDILTTLIAWGGLSEITLFSYTIDTGNVPPGAIMLRIFNAGDGLGEVDFWNVTGPEQQTMLVENLGFKRTDSLSTVAGTYTLGLDLDDDGTLEHQFSLPELLDGTEVNLYLVTDVNGPFLLLQRLSDSLLELRPERRPPYGGIGNADGDFRGDQ